MATVRLRWAPSPYRAGFTITDDTDAADLPSVRATYEVLAAHGLRTTKTVWAFPPLEPSGIPGLPASTLRGITLADPGYRDYCVSLAERGFEIALHGATAGNNPRETTAEALELMDRTFPRSRTYICHARNADNPYWLEKIVSGGPLRRILGLLSRRHRCSGEDPSSRYFWGDLCRERGFYIRLYRTREPDTLAVNPSMPYHESGKPYVAGWFSATKRSLVGVTQEHVLDRLERDWGMCILYQYLHRWALPDGSAARPEFVHAVQRLASHPRIWCDTASRLLDRLRVMQGLFLAVQGHSLWLINTQEEAVEQVQIECTERPRATPPGVVHEHAVLRVDRMAAGQVVRVDFNAPVTPRGRNAFMLDREGHGRCDSGHGRCWFNAGTDLWSVDGREVAPMSHALGLPVGHPADLPRGRLEEHEQTRLFLHQMGILVREVLFKGRHLDTSRWLGSAKIPLEDHAHWE